ASTLTRQPSLWQRELLAAYREPLSLLRDLGLAERIGRDLPAATQLQRFPLRVPRGYVARMRRGDPQDPLLLQVLPRSAEYGPPVPGYSPDPLREQAALRAPGLLQKYAGRALLIATGACAVHCRYCFRREFPYDASSGGGGRWRDAVAALRSDPSITELIVSGGDPLMLSDLRLAELTDALRPIGQLRRLRIHSRLPIVLPERVDAGLLGWLASLPWSVVIVLHANHANEIDATVRDACSALRAQGVTLLNQSVLLAGVNDSADALAELSESLFAAGVLPYYLHLLDPVVGTAHFAVPEERAVAELQALAARLPGYLVPRLVREIPDRPAKTVISAGLSR
ncbi:MAG: EF-P beta-lysylation protein EpmB, partial [Steroidobacteraceae bacterium]|nr:EF-P beta-lysylation protein EpmB [Steroidobacteraceae bacterium]